MRILAMTVVAGGLLTAPLALAQTPAAAAGASAASAWTVPHTAWGDPDLQGSYTNSNESNTPMERPAEFDGRTLDSVTPEEMAKLAKQRAERVEETAIIIGSNLENETGAGPTHWYENYNPKNSRAWRISDPPDGHIPEMTPEAQTRVAIERFHRPARHTGPFNGPEDFGLYVRCITRGVPGSMMPAIYGNSYDIIQSPGYVAIQYEMVHETRVIPLDRRPHVSDDIHAYMGDPRGWWEGDTLVVETTNFREASAYQGASEHLRLLERFTPVGPDKIEWSVTLDDPDTWERPWTFGMQLTRDSSSRVFEYACHEGNKAMVNTLSAARVADKAAE